MQILTNNEKLRKLSKKKLKLSIAGILFIFLFSVLLLYPRTEANTLIPNSLSKLPKLQKQQRIEKWKLQIQKGRNPAFIKRIPMR